MPNIFARVKGAPCCRPLAIISGSSPLEMVTYTYWGRGSHTSPLSTQATGHCRASTTPTTTTATSLTSVTTAAMSVAWEATTAITTHTTTSTGSSRRMASAVPAATTCIGATPRRDGSSRDGEYGWGASFADYAFKQGIVNKQNEFKRGLDADKANIYPSAKFGIYKCRGNDKQIQYY